MVRDSIAVIRAWVPLWKPRHRMRAAVATLALGAAVLILAWTAPQPVRNLYTRVTASVRTSVGAVVKLAALDRLRFADKPAVRAGRSTVAGGILTLPPTFRTTDGSYDLVLHFHGNVGLVEESFSLVGINAPVVIANVGLTTSAYEQRFGGSAVMPAVLARVDEELVKRGLGEPRHARVALTAWSAGYGAVASILESGVLGDSLDAIVLLDGFHSAYDNKRNVDVTRLAAFQKFAERAMRGERLLTLTNSEIDPYTYPGTRATTDAFLGLLGLERSDGGARPELPALSQLHGVPRDKLFPLQPTGECHKGSFHVRGYKGVTPEDHMAHLVYMATIGLRELAERWNAPRAL